MGIDWFLTCLGIDWLLARLGDLVVIGTPWVLSGYWHTLGIELLLAYFGDWGFCDYWHTLGIEWLLARLGD